MAVNNMVVTEGNVQGNISQCLLNDFIKETNREHVYSFVQRDTHVVYNTCTGQETSVYTLPSLTPFGAVTCLCVFLILLLTSLITLVTR